MNQTEIFKLNKWLTNENKTGYKFKPNVIKKFNLDWFNYINEFMVKYELGFIQSIYHIVNLLTAIPTCESNFVYKFNGFNSGYSTICKDKCKNCKSKVYDQIKKNNIKKWGVSNPMQLKLIKEKQVSNNLKKWGVKNSFQREEVKEKIKKTTIKKWGVDHHTKVQEIKEKKENTNLKKYGVKHSTQNLIVKEKVKETNLKRWGHEYALSSPVIQEKIKKTNIETRGVDYVMKDPTVREKAKNTNVKKYGSKTWAESDAAIEHTFKKLKTEYPDIKEYDHTTKEIAVKCKSCICGKGEYQTSVRLFRQRINVNGIHPCINMNPIKTGISTYHEDIVNWLKSIGDFNIEENNRSLLNGKEIDIFLPNHNFGIEFNGIYWHSELYKEKQYHQQKSILAKERGISLFHIWEDDWLAKPHIIKSMIMNKLGVSIKIGGRKCQIREVNSNETGRFLDENHLQGKVNASVRLGLFFNGELVALMTLGKLRKVVNQSSAHHEWELYRFVSKCGYTVQGGFSKLLNYFINNYNPGKIHTYASLDHSIGGVYLKSGFELNHMTCPGYWWVVNGIKQYRYHFRKDRLVKEGADVNKSETQIMHERGHWRIWNSGNLKFTLVR